MKQIGLLTITILFSLIQVQAQKTKAKVDMAFDKTVDGITAHDFGSIVFGANGKVDFTFTNQGTTPLVISDVKSSCGCTIPTWTKEPVAPGEKGNVEIVYNTKLPGTFNKTVVVYSNANNSPVRLEVRGKVNTQPNDLKPGATIPANTSGTEGKPGESVSGSRGAGSQTGVVKDIDEASDKKALQRAAYKARTAKAQEKQAAGTKTTAVTKTTAETKAADEAKPVTTGKSSATTTTRKK